jgi:hypothetical protein
MTEKKQRPDGVGPSVTRSEREVMAQLLGAEPGEAIPDALDRVVSSHYRKIRALSERIQELEDAP